MQVLKRVEWPTLGVLVGCYLLWSVAIFSGWPFAIAIPLAAIAIALHSSLQHEVIHGHPFGVPALDAALVWPPLTLLIPYARFRDTHLAHHRDESLTDPYDDPESSYLAPETWARLPWIARALLIANNTLAGRVLIGPAVGWVGFAVSEMNAARRDPDIAAVWLRHGLGVVALLGVVRLGAMPVWAYLLAAYAGIGLLKIRTFLEHRAHRLARARTVIIEDRGPLAFLFLNNNLHVVHHMHPSVPWYALPAKYAARRAHYRARNDGYVYRSYLDVIRAHLWRPKEPVAHPLMTLAAKPERIAPSPAASFP